MLQQVFLSYRHESAQHAQAVRRLGELLRNAGISVALDQFLLEELAGGPAEGWPKWSEDAADRSACILVVASKGWFAAFENKSDSPGAGLGAAVEADILRQKLYDDKGVNTKLRLAFLDDTPDHLVPTRLRAWHSFRPFANDDQLQGLTNWIAGCLGIGVVELPAVRWPDPIVGFAPDLANRTKREWPAIVELLAGRSRERILLYDGASGLGKSALIHQAIGYAKKLNIPVGRVDFRGGVLDVAGILGQFDLDLGAQLPTFSRGGADKVHLLRKDLRTLREPVLVVFDTYEHIATNKTVADWLNQQFLVEVETAPGLAVIIAGQEVPQYRSAGWRDLALHLPLSPITEIEHWTPWVEQHYPEFRNKGADLPTVLMISKGNPMVTSRTCEAISKG
jgi:hypothetical protein